MPALLQFLTTAPGRESTESKLLGRFGEAAFDEAYRQGWITRTPHPEPSKRVVSITLKGREQLRLGNPGNPGALTIAERQRLEGLLSLHFALLSPEEQRELRRLLEKEGELSGRLMEALLTRTINDITYGQMGSIVRRVHRLSTGERGSAKVVADVLTEEIGAEKALSYVEKAHAAGLITGRQYEELRALLFLPQPRERVMLGTQRLQRELSALEKGARALLEKPVQDLNRDAERLRRAWGI